ncbi:MAG: Ppx/GppA family phosphatase [bacterium]|nr:Ppx/GppA family phosphatase [bacterium]
MRLGIADLGSNTARLVVFAYEAGRWFQISDGIREPIRLGEGLWKTGRLSDAAIDRAGAALELFFDYARATSLDRLEILGTSAIREASNGETLMGRVEELGYQLDVITGEQEAALSVAAVANGFAFEDAWVMDLGGGSSQISLMKSRRYEFGTAHPLGTVRLTETFLDSDPPSKGEIRALENRVAEVLGDVAKTLDGTAPLVAIGGTVRNLARIAQKSGGYPLPMLHGYRLTHEALEDVTERLLETPVEERRRLSGINPDRADIIVAGALVYRWLVRRSGLDHILISGHGVREGAFYRHFLPEPHLLENVRRFSVLNRASRYSLPPGHVDHVRFLARRLFKQLAPLHRLSDVDRELLDAAATLHDIGTTLDYYRHHKHGAYLINISPLNGFSHREMAMISSLVRFHRRGAPKFGEYAALMGPDDDKRLLQLATCLRLAESLERARAARIRDLEVEIEPEGVQIRLEADETPTIELWEARKDTELFQQAFGRELMLEANPRLAESD